MRKLVVLLALCATAHADPQPIDASAVIDKLEVYRDETGNYYIVPRPGAFEKDADKWVFYGDGKKLYQQRVIGASVSGKRREWTVWSPRAKKMNGGDLEIDDKQAVLACRHEKDGKRALVLLAGDEAHTLLAKAKLYAPLWQREAHLLARDDDGVYYFIDMLREEYGGNGYRVFAGQKGSMKELAMTNIVRDSAGEIYATKTGQLKLLTAKDKTAYWIKGGKKTELTLVDVHDDRYLIYRDLGVYGALGAVCDDM
jgi:hypothetical protein